MNIVKQSSIYFTNYQGHQLTTNFKNYPKFSAYLVSSNKTSRNFGIASEGIPLEEIIGAINRPIKILSNFVAGQNQLEIALTPF